MAVGTRWVHSIDAFERGIPHFNQETVAQLLRPFVHNLFCRARHHVPPPPLRSTVIFPMALRIAILPPRVQPTFTSQPGESMREDHATHALSPSSSQYSRLPLPSFLPSFLLLLLIDSFALSADRDISKCLANTVDETENHRQTHHRQTALKQ